MNSKRRNEHDLTSIASSAIRSRHIIFITEVKSMKGREGVREKIEGKIVFSLSHPPDLFRLMKTRTGTEIS